MILRFEHKYLVPESLREPLRRAVAPFVRPDPYAEIRKSSELGSYVGYQIRTIYYDSSRFENYFANEAGLEERAKPRIRSYNQLADDDQVILEVKRRHGAVGSKSRAPVRMLDLPAFLDTGRVRKYVEDTPGFPDAVKSAGSFLFRHRRHALRPVLLVAYEREAYIGRDSRSLRITFDGCVRSSPFPELSALERVGYERPLLRGRFVLEVKYDRELGYPMWIRPFLGRHGISRVAFSKYYESVFDQDMEGRYVRARCLGQTYRRASERNIVVGGLTQVPAERRYGT